MSDEDIEAMLSKPIDEWSPQYKRALVRLARNEQWRDQTKEKIKEHQAWLVVLIGLFSAWTFFRDTAAEALQAIGSFLGGEGQ